MYSGHLRILIDHDPGTFTTRIEEILFNSEWMDPHENEFGSIHFIRNAFCVFTFKCAKSFFKEELHSGSEKHSLKKLEHEI